MRRGTGGQADIGAPGRVGRRLRGAANRTCRRATPPAPEPSRARTDSTVTYAASAKNDSAVTRSARRSRASFVRAENCQATVAAEDTSMTDSSPNPTSAVEDAAAPDARATTASTTL